MRGLTGLALLMAGGLAGVYGLFPTEDDRGAALEAALNSVNRTLGAGPEATAPPAPIAVAAERQPRVFSPTTPLFQPTRPVELAPSPAAPREANLVEPRADTIAAPRPAVGADPAAPAVKADTKAVTTAAPLVSPVAGDDAGRAELARSLQRELKRVGCYDGEISGAWSASTRQAMKAFTERVNATLPVSEPDYILLTLVQGHAGEACGRSCPGDQVMAQDGKCQPKAIVAQAGRKAATKRVATASATVDGAKATAAGPRRDEQAQPNRERTAQSVRGLDGGKSGAATVAAKRPDPQAGWTATVASEKPVSQAAPVVAARPEPLPGRMAIGAASVAAVAPPVVAPALAKAPAAATGPAPPAAVSEDDAQAKAKSEPTQPPKRAARARPSSSNDYYYAPQPKPRRISPPSYVGAYVAPSSGSSKSARVRRMHYDLFQRPDRTTN